MKPAETATKATAAEGTEEKEKKQKEQTGNFMVLDKLFRIPPVRKSTVEDSDRTIIVEHRVGKMVVFFTQKELLRKSGLEKEWMEEYKRLDTRLTNKIELKKTTDATWANKKQILRRMTSSFRKHLDRIYAPQGAMARVTFVPVDDEGTLGYFIQALVDLRSKALLIGKPEDLGLWNEVTACREKSHVNNWNEAMTSAKALLRLPNLNKDLQARMKLVISGDVPMSVSGLLPAPEDKK